jgi:pilus assembly protein Flp/PilA
LPQIELTLFQLLGRKFDERSVPRHRMMKKQDDVCKEPGMNTIARFANDESGATAIEYGLIAALIAVGIIAAATSLGGGLNKVFGTITTKLNAA